MPSKSDNGKVVVENVNVPGHTVNVNAEKYFAMEKAFLKVLPTCSPGLPQKEFLSNIIEHLPDTLFPGGAKSGWWAKTVQLDLEAKGFVVREKTKPLRWYKKPS